MAEIIPLRPAEPAFDVDALARAVAEKMRQQQESSPRKTFGELADDWLASEAKRLVQPDNERRHIGHLKPLWGLCEGELTARVVKDHLASLLQPTGPLGPSTVNKVRSTGARILDEAVTAGEWHGANPFRVARRMREVKPSYEIFTLEEIRAFVPHLRPDRRRLALTMVYLGPRPGELLGLRKVDVDLAGGWLLIHRSHGRQATKTGRPRRVPIPDELVPVLREAMEASPSEYVFPAPDGHRQREDTKLARALQTALGKAGLVRGYAYSCRRKGCGHRGQGATMEERRCPKCGMRLWCHPLGKPARFYDLRHCAATLHRQAGCDPLVIKLVLGHAARDMTDDTYTHLSDGYLKKELNKLTLDVLNKGSPSPVGGEGGLTKGEATMLPNGLPSNCNPRPGAWEARALPTELPPQASGCGSTTPLLTVKQVAELLRLSCRTVYSLIQAGRLQAVRLGGLLRFQASYIDAVMAGGLP